MEASSESLDEPGRWLVGIYGVGNIVPGISQNVYIETTLEPLQEIVLRIIEAWSENSDDQLNDW